MSNLIEQRVEAARRWRFPMVSHADTSFALDMGYRRLDAGHGGYWPGVSAFRKESGRIVRLSDAELGPMDDFCVYYHLMEMIPGGDAGFTPKFRYG